VTRGVTYTAFLLSAVLLLGPVVVLIWHAGSLGVAWHQLLVRSAIRTTLGSGVIALALVIGLGMPMSWVLARNVTPGWKKIWGVLLVIPLLMPPLVVGLVVAYVLGPVSNWWPQVGDNTWTALIVAEVVEALPYFVIAAWGTLGAISRHWEEDVWVLGKTPAQTARYVIWPLARPGLLVAASMAWARIVGAFGAPIVVAYHPTALPVAIWITLEEQGLPAALALSLWLLLVSLPLPVAVNGWWNHVDGLH